MEVMDMRENCGGNPEEADKACLGYKSIDQSDIAMDDCEVHRMVFNGSLPGDCAKRVD